MKAQTIAATLGIGVHFIVAGGFLVGVGIAELLGAVFPEAPVGIWYLVVGGLALVFGVYACSYSTEKVEQKIEKHFTVEAQVRRQPVVAVGVALAFGYLVSLLFSRRTVNIDEKETAAEIAKELNKTESPITPRQRQSNGAKRGDQWFGRQTPASRPTPTVRAPEKDDSFMGDLAETAKKAIKSAVMTAAVSAISAAGGAAAQAFAPPENKPLPDRDDPPRRPANAPGRY
jgi:hypothetical protein